MSFNPFLDDDFDESERGSDTNKKNNTTRNSEGRNGLNRRSLKPVHKVAQKKSLSQ